MAELVVEHTQGNWDSALEWWGQIPKPMHWGPGRSFWMGQMAKVRGTKTFEHFDLSKQANELCHKAASMQVASKNTNNKQTVSKHNKQAHVVAFAWDVFLPCFEAYLFGLFDSLFVSQKALKVGLFGTKKGWKLGKKCVFSNCMWRSAGMFLVYFVAILRYLDILYETLLSKKRTGQKKTEEVWKTQWRRLLPYYRKVVQTLGNLTLHKPSPSSWWTPPQQVAHVCWGRGGGFLVLSVATPLW